MPCVPDLEGRPRGGCCSGYGVFFNSIAPIELGGECLTEEQCLGEDCTAKLVALRDTHPSECIRTKARIELQYAYDLRGMEVTSTWYQGQAARTGTYDEGYDVQCPFLPACCYSHQCREPTNIRITDCVAVSKKACEQKAHVGPLAPGPLFLDCDSVDGSIVRVGTYCRSKRYLEPECGSWLSRIPSLYTQSHPSGVICRCILSVAPWVPEEWITEWGWSFRSCLREVDDPRTYAEVCDFSNVQCVPNVGFPVGVDYEGFSVFIGPNKRYDPTFPTCNIALADVAIDEDGYTVPVTCLRYVNNEVTSSGLGFISTSDEVGSCVGAYMDLQYDSSYVCN